MQRRWRRFLWLVMVGLIVYTGLVLPFVKRLTVPDEITLTPSEYATLAQTEATLVGNEADTQYITVKLFGFLPVKRVRVNVLPFDEVLVGGLPIGICGEVDGAIVTAAAGDLAVGDVIHAVDGVPVHNCAEYQQQTRGKTQAQLTYSRQQRSYTKNFHGDLDLPLRDTTTGVGILTFVNPENQNFAALGHQMGDFDTGAAVDLSGGTVHAVKVFGIEPTTGKKTGLIKSSIRQHAPLEGSITHGNQYGIAGCLQPDSQLLQQMTTTLPVATRYHVKPGKAILRTSLDGVTVEEFTCEILKTRYQNTKHDKSMVIRVTDPRLLAQTGGIVHGMSGSPIIQDNHLVGVLTHAITQDPAKGYAIYLDFVAL